MSSRVRRSVWSGLGVTALVLTTLSGTAMAVAAPASRATVPCIPGAGACPPAPPPPLCLRKCPPRS